MESLLGDIRYALRMLNKSPGVTLVILVMLTLGIGANTAVFTIFDAILLRPLSLDKPEQLVHLWATRTEGAFQQMPFSFPNYLDLKQQAKSFSSIGGYSRNTVTLAGKDGAEQIPAAVATSGLFETLGVRPILGRTFNSADDQAQENVAVLLSYGAWQRRFAGDPSVLGKTLVIDGEPAEIAGVLPREFEFAPGRSADLWVSARLQGWVLRRNAYWLYPVARLRPGVTLQQAQLELSAIAGSLEKQYPDVNKGLGGQVVDLRQEIVGPMQPVLIAVMAAIGFVLLITCANVAGLLLARSLPRKREISIRIALGARSLRIARQLLTESLLLALLGGAAGVAAAYWSVPALISMLPESILLATPPLQGLTVNIPVLWFALALSLATGILFGLAPVVQTFKPSLQHELQEGSRGSIGSGHRFRDVLVVSEMALAVVLLAGAGLMLRSLDRVLSVDPGFNTHNLLTSGIILPEKKYADSPRQLALQKELLQSLGSLPGVEQAAAVSTVPLSGSGSTSRFDVEGNPKTAGGPEYEAHSPSVTANYFSAMSIPLRTGRFFNSQDTPDSTHVVIVNQALVDMVFHGRDPIGKRLNFTYTSEPNYVTIVGVVGNQNVERLDAPVTPIIYDCYDQNPNPYFSVVVRTKGEPSQLTSAVTHTIHRLEPEAAIYQTSSMAQIISTSPTMMVRAYPAYLIGGFAVLALLLASLGLYGVLAYTVTQRTRELGVRMAFGAQPGDLLGMVVKSGIKLAVAGIALGTAGGLAVARLIASLLFGVEPTDILTFVTVGVVLFLAALAASYVPALRATRVDPMVALRCE
ncbi:MAG TPA: ABC transporter permease [Terriglobales bacterium]